MRSLDREGELFNINDGSSNETSYYDKIFLFFSGFAAFNTLISLILDYFEKKLIVVVIVLLIVLIFILMWFT